MTKKFTLFLALICACCSVFATNYLTFTAEEDSSSFGMEVYDMDSTPTVVQYSLDDGQTWDTLTGGPRVVLAKRGDKALLKGVNPQGFPVTAAFLGTRFEMSGAIAASGSVMSIIDGTGDSKTIPCELCFSGLFSGCEALTQAPELPATTLADYCYYAMFSYCTNLTKAPELPATQLTDGCYMDMFYGCTSLTKSPALLATEVEYNSYKNMFSECAKLSEIMVCFTDYNYASRSGAWVRGVAPHGTFILPKGSAKTYGKDRIPYGWEVKYIDYLTFTAMLSGSSFSITSIGEHIPDVQYSLDSGFTWSPLLPGDTITLAKYRDCVCLRGVNPQGFSMGEEDYTHFSMSGSIAVSGSVMSLIDGIGVEKKIPNANCFYGLFEGCNRMSSAPDLPSMELTEGCYKRMFTGCTRLVKAPELPAKKLAAHCYESMFDSCLNVNKIVVGFSDWADKNGTMGWVADVASSGTFVAPQALAKAYGANNIPEGWQAESLNYLTFTAEEDSSTFGLDGSDIYASILFADIQCSLDNGESWFSISGGDTILLKKKGDKALLKGNNPRGFIRYRDPNISSFVMTGSIAASGSVMSLLDVAGVSKTIPSESCFERLFEGCASLTQAPELPATELKEACYSEMFAECTNLKRAPELPATKLSSLCYMRMFVGCSNLTQAPELPATEVSAYGYVFMFAYCDSLRKAPALPATVLHDGCYQAMFYNCISLTEAPELPEAEIITISESGEGCYRTMFDSCQSLSKIKVHFSEWKGTDISWVAGVAPTGTFICPKALAKEYGVNRIPEGWSVEYIDDGTSTQVVEATHCDIWTEDRTLFVRGVEGRIEVYDLNGKLLRSAQGGVDETVRFVLPGMGTYVVKTETKSVKIMN